MRVKCLAQEVPDHSADITTCQQPTHQLYQQTTRQSSLVNSLVYQSYWQVDNDKLTSNGELT